MSHRALEVRNHRGEIAGFRCWTCNGVFPSMWGDTCNRCREQERRHRELVDAIRAGKSSPTAHQAEQPK